VAAGPVSRILSAGFPAGRSFLWATHYCVAQATYPEVETHRAGTCPGRSLSSLPIWSCSVWGLPCPPHYCGGGALLPHLFTLTPLPGRYVLCGTFRRLTLKSASRTLSGTLLCGVRTFLPRRWTQRERPSGPAANTSLYAMGLRPMEFQVAGQTIHNSRWDSGHRLSERAITRLFLQSEKCGASLAGQPIAAVPA